MKSLYSALVGVESLWQLWGCVTRSVMQYRNGRRTVGANLSCRVSESILYRYVQNLSRGSDTIENLELTYFSCPMKDQPKLNSDS